MPNLHSCTVSYPDLEGVTHSVEVAAESLYEAAVRGAKALKLSDWCGYGPGTPTELTIEASPPRTRHTITFGRVNEWLKNPGKSPREILLKKRLREMLEGAS